MRSLQVNLDGVGLVVGVLTSLKVEELSVGEKSEVLLHVERLVVSSLLTVDGVEVAKVLRHVGAAATVEVCHFDEWFEAGSFPLNWVSKHQLLLQSVFN